MPKPIISGTAPSIAARVVIMIGRKRARAASRIASYGASPRWRWAARAKSIIRMPFFLTMPISSTTPINAITENSWPKPQSMNTAPIPAEGSVERMVSGCTKLS
ncbi:hypothetical protein D3C78_1714640 [compost metagenome]